MTEGPIPGLEMEAIDQPQRLGGCVCGAVRYRIRGAFNPPTACHCHMCRRHHGALGIFVGSSREKVEISGVDQVQWFSSSTDAERGSCRQCGTKLFWRKVNGPALDVTVGSLDRSDDLTLTAHIWVAHRGDYETIPSDIPVYAASSMRNGKRAEPITKIEPLSASDQTIGPPFPGRCLCGAVYFEVTGALENVFICHCPQCRRWHGAAGTYSKTRVEDLAIHGEANLIWYLMSPEIIRGFCRICSSCLFMQILKDGKPAVQISISAGALDGPTGLKTERQLFLSAAPF